MSNIIFPGGRSYGSAYTSHLLFTRHNHNSKLKTTDLKMH